MENFLSSKYKSSTKILHFIDILSVDNDAFVKKMLQWLLEDNKMKSMLELNFVGWGLVAIENQKTKNGFLFEVFSSHTCDPHPIKHENGTHEKWGNHSMALMHIFFGAESTVPKYRKGLNGTTDLIANTGGILGLCLGFSILSGVEVVYFLTLPAYWKYCRRRMLKRRRDRTQHKDQEASNGFLSQLLFQRKSTNKIIQVNPKMIPIYSKNGPNPNSSQEMSIGRRSWGNSQGHHFYGATSFAPKYNLPAHYGYMY